MQVILVIYSHVRRDETSPTYDLDEQHGFVLSGGVCHTDGVVPLILSLRPLNHKAAQCLPVVNTDAALRRCDYLV